MVAASVETFLAEVEADPELYRFVVQRPSTAGTASDYTAVISKHVSTVIGDVLRAVGRDAGVAEPWGFAMVGAARAAAERWLDEPTMSRAALADSLDGPAVDRRLVGRLVRLVVRRGGRPVGTAAASVS